MKNDGLLETNCIYTKPTIQLTPKNKSIPNVEKNLVQQDEGASRSAKMGDNASYEKVTF